MADIAKIDKMVTEPLPAIGDIANYVVYYTNTATNEPGVLEIQLSTALSPAELLAHMGDAAGVDFS